MSAPILIVDDDPVQRRLLEASVMRMGFRTILTDGGVNCLNMLKARKDIGLVLLDLVMPDMDGFTVLRTMRESGITTPVIVQTAQGGLDMAVEAIKLGAVDFVAKPVPLERLQVSVTNALKLDALTSEIRRVRFSANGQLTFADMVARSASMNNAMRLGRQASLSDEPVLIEGEPGVGKQMLARAIQGTSRRRGKPFVVVHCASMNLADADCILFGRDESGSPGSGNGLVGQMRAAEGGTLFFDNLSSLTQNTQLKLLKTLQTGEFWPVGAQKPSRADVRVIGASPRRLIDLVESGQFHPDLFAILSNCSITLPSLRDRSEDIALLVHHFMLRFTCEEGRQHISSISPYALARLNSYDWPGNVRQLENATFRAVLMCEKSALGPDDFPQLAIPMLGGVLASDISVDQSLVPDTADADEADLDDRSQDGNSGFFYGIDRSGEVLTLAAAEEAMIRLAIQHYDGQLSEVARRLGIGRTTLYRKLKDYEIDVASITGSYDAAGRVSMAGIGAQR